MGLRAIKFRIKDDALVCLKVLGEGEELLFVTEKGVIVRTNADKISQQSRALDCCEILSAFVLTITPFSVTKSNSSPSPRTFKQTNASSLILNFIALKPIPALFCNLN